MKFKLGKLSLSFLFLFSTTCFATAYQLPPTSESLIGQMQYLPAESNDNVVTVAKRFDLGFNAMEKANPELDMGKGFTSGTSLQIPTQHLLPDQAREGIVINLPEMRMYYYPANGGQVLTYPIGIGKLGKTIPIRKTIVSRKKENPIWVPPDDIREFNLQQGIVLPETMPAGPDNPLGPYAIYMGIPTYLIHSTIFPESVGKRASFGCIRMYESDIKEFFPSITPHIPVAIINSPVKLGWQDNHVFMEVHPPLEEHDSAFDASLPGMVHLISEKTKGHDVLIDWQLVSYLYKEKDGVPHDIGFSTE